MSGKRKPSVASAQSPKAAFQMESRLWERAFDSIPDLIAIFDYQHRIVRVNQPMARRLERTPQQCVGLKCYECVHGSSELPPFCPHTLSLADGKEHAAEVHDDRLGGYFRVTTTPLRDEAGRVIGSVYVARDINEQKKALDVLRHLLESCDHERHLISCEIHDGLAQQLASAIMQLEAYKSFGNTNPKEAAKALVLGLQSLHDGNAEARRLIGGLRYPQLNEGGILAAIENLVKESSKRSKMKIEFHCNVAHMRLEPILANTVFRIVQECLNNACRHSKSKKAKVELTQHDDQLRIEVRDRGVGFKVDRVGEGHFGLKGIQERAKVFGGHAVIKSSRRKGTDIIVELPLHPVVSSTP